MITIRSAEGVSRPTLIGVEATLTTDKAVYILSSNGNLLDHTTSLAGGLFGSIAWPQIRFRVAPDIAIEQQLLLPPDGSAAAFSWQLCEKTMASAHLEIRPVFAGCGKKLYRDVGFRFQNPEEGGRLTWLPSVLGPTIIADTNGAYLNDDARNARANDEEVVTAGTFHFELSNRPSVLILTNDRLGPTVSVGLIGRFLAGLLPQSSKVGDAPEPALDVATSSMAA